MTVYKINDLIQCDFYRIPKAFYSNPKYIEMSSAAKLAYARLYDRLSLSQKNGWINANGEVYLNFKRKKLAEALGVGNKKATDIFKELVEKGLIMDVRVGQGKPNRIYIVKPEVSEHQARNFVDEENARCAEMTALESDEVGDTEEMLEGDPQKQQVKKRQNDISRSTEMTGQEASKAHPNNTNSNKTDINHIDNSQSVITDRQLFNKILAQCQLECFDKDIRRIFYDAVERLFYCRELKIGTSVLPGENVRSRLCELDYSVLESALHKMHKNMRDTKNPTGYVMSVIFNCLTEDFTETHLDPYLNHFRGGGD